MRSMHTTMYTLTTSRLNYSLLLHLELSMYNNSYLHGIVYDNDFLWINAIEKIFITSQIYYQSLKT